MGLRRRGDIWFLRKVIDGRRYERSTGFSDLKATRRRAAEIEVELRSGSSAGRRTARPSRIGGKPTSASTRRVNGRERRCVTEAPSCTPCHTSGPSDSMRFGHQTVSSICTNVGRRLRPTRAGRTRSASAKALCSGNGGSSKRCFSEPSRMACWSGIRGAGLNAHRTQCEHGSYCLTTKCPFAPCCRPGFSGF